MLGHLYIRAEPQAPINELVTLKSPNKATSLESLRPIRPNSFTLCLGIIYLT